MLCSLHAPLCSDYDQPDVVNDAEEQQPVDHQRLGGE
jgi:hypothetical protein